MGARVLGTTRFAAAAELVSALGGEPIADDDFVDGVLDRTGGHGADVILELVGAPHFPGNLKALALKGRIAVIGTGAGADAPLPLIGLMVKRGAIYGSVLRARSLEDKALAVRAFEREIVPSLASGRVRPIVDSVFPAEEVTAALDRMEGPGKLGRVLIEFA
jgi:NADPH:quinone reductase-like Zn-dependent oxidoreductase